MVLDVGLHLLDLLQSPYLTVGDMMECSHYTLHTDLAEHIEGYFIVWAEPAPSLFHKIPVIGILLASVSHVSESLATLVGDILPVLSRNLVLREQF